MPPKKDPENSENEDGLDAIADATSRILDDSENLQSEENTSANLRNSTKKQKNQNDSARNQLSRGTSRAAKESNSDVDKDRLPGPYVPSDLSYALQEAQLQLRRMTGEKISQSLIIECALEICLSDFDKRDDESGLAKLVRQKYYQQK